MSEEIWCARRNCNCRESLSQFSGFCSAECQTSGPCPQPIHFAPGQPRPAPAPSSQQQQQQQQAPAPQNNQPPPGVGTGANPYQNPYGSTGGAGGGQQQQSQTATTSGAMGNAPPGASPTSPGANQGQGQQQQQVSNGPPPLPFNNGDLIEMVPKCDERLRVDIAGSEDVDGTAVEVWKSLGPTAAGQHFKVHFRRDGGVAFAPRCAPKRFIDSRVLGGAKRPVHIWRANDDNPNQSFNVEPHGDGYFLLVAKPTGHVLDCPGGGRHGADIITWDRRARDNQLFRFIILDPKTHKPLHGGSGSSGSSHGNQIATYNGPVAKCANPKCQCDSYNGQPGQFCCRGCPRSGPCPGRMHIFTPPPQPQTKHLQQQQQGGGGGYPGQQDNRKQGGHGGRHEAPESPDKIPVIRIPGHIIVHWKKDKDEFEAEEQVLKCPYCMRDFGWSLWRHHCKVCGRVTCDDCAPEDVEHGNDRKRVCAPCRKKILSTVPTHTANGAVVVNTEDPGAPLAQYPMKMTDKYIREIVAERIRQDRNYFDVITGATHYPFDFRTPPPPLDQPVRPPVVKPGQQPPKLPEPKQQSITTLLDKITIVDEDCLVQAQVLKKGGHKNVCVLNAANERHVGGGAFSHFPAAQEEYLCRNTTVPLSLYKHRDHHQDQFRPWKLGMKVLGHTRDSWYPFTAFCGIFAQNVEVFALKDEPLHQKDHFSISMASMAAQDLRAKSGGGPFDRNILLNKLRTLFRMLVLNDVDAVVFVPIGCGVFLNPPDEVAWTFKLAIEELLSQYTPETFPIKKIDFAIMGKTSTNLDAFKKVFCENPEEPVPASPSSFNAPLNFNASPIDTSGSAPGAGYSNPYSNPYSSNIGGGGGGGNDNNANAGTSSGGTLSNASAAAATAPTTNANTGASVVVSTGAAYAPGHISGVSPMHSGSGSGSGSGGIPSPANQPMNTNTNVPSAQQQQQQGAYQPPPQQQQGAYQPPPQQQQGAYQPPPQQQQDQHQHQDQHQQQGQQQQGQQQFAGNTNYQNYPPPS